jgi:hypothetical protein
MYHDTTVVQFTKMLLNLRGLFDKAAAHATARSFDTQVLADARLAPDQLALVRQVQIACDTVKLAVAFLTGQPAQPQEDNEASIEQIQGRVRSIITLLEGLTAKDFEGAATRVVSQPRWKGEWMTGEDYFIQHAVPNFYFHLATTYAILRHNGVAIGKRDYLGAQNKRPPTA